MEKIAVFGDVHGEIDLLKTLLAKLDIEYPGINIYSTGDLVDRGPDSKAVIQLFIDRGITTIRGNHDDVFAKAIEFGSEDMDNHLYKGMGGRATCTSYGCEIRNWNWEEDCGRYQEAVPKEHLEFVSALPFYLFLEAGEEKYFMTHAGLSRASWAGVQHVWNDLSVEEQLIKSTSLYNGDILWNHKRNGFAQIPGYTQILGHVPVDEGMVLDGAILVDTGCGKGGGLTAVILPDRKFIVV